MIPVTFLQIFLAAILARAGWAFFSLIRWEILFLRHYYSLKSIYTKDEWRWKAPTRDYWDKL